MTSATTAGNLVDPTKPPLSHFANWDVSCAASAFQRARALTHAPQLHDGDNPPPELLDLCGPAAVLVNRRQFREAFTELTMTVRDDGKGGLPVILGVDDPGDTALGFMNEHKVSFLSLPLQTFADFRPRKQLEGETVCRLNGGKWVDAAEVALCFVLFGKGERSARAQLCYDIFFKPRTAHFRLRDFVVQRVQAVLCEATIEVFSLLAVISVKLGIIDRLPHAVAVHHKAQDLSKGLVTRVARLATEFDRDVGTTSVVLNAALGTEDATPVTDSLEHRRARTDMLQRRHHEAVLEWAENVLLSFRALRTIHAASIEKAVHDSLARKAAARAEREAKMKELLEGLSNLSRAGVARPGGRRVSLLSLRPSGAGHGQAEGFLAAAAAIKPASPAAGAGTPVAIGSVGGLGRPPVVITAAEPVVPPAMRRRSIGALPGASKALLREYRLAEIAATPKPTPSQQAEAAELRRLREAESPLAMRRRSRSRTPTNKATPKSRRASQPGTPVARTPQRSPTKKRSNSDVGISSSGDVEVPDAAAATKRGHGFSTWIAMFKVARKLRSKAGIIRLASRTKFKKPELMDLQANFWKHWLDEDSRRVSGMAPLPGEDVLTLAAFESFLLEHYPQVVQVSASAITSLFDTFNTSGSGLMNFDELVKGLSTLLRGTAKQKAAMLFSIFDVLGLGALSETDMVEKLRCAVATVCPSRNGTQPRSLVAAASGRFLHLVDVGGDDDGDDDGDGDGTLQVDAAPSGEGKGDEESEGGGEGEGKGEGEGDAEADEQTAAEALAATVDTAFARDLFELLRTEPTTSHAETDETVPIHSPDFTSALLRHPLLFDCFMSLVLPGCSAKSVEPLYREQTTAGTQWTMGLLRAFWTGVVPEEWQRKAAPLGMRTPRRYRRHRRDKKRPETPVAAMVTAPRFISTCQQLFNPPRGMQFAAPAVWDMLIRDKPSARSPVSFRQVLFMGLSQLIGRNVARRAQFCFTLADASDVGIVTMDALNAVIRPAHQNPRADTGPSSGRVSLLEFQMNCVKHPHHLADFERAFGLSSSKTEKPGKGQTVAELSRLLLEGGRATIAEMRAEQKTKDDTREPVQGTVARRLASAALRVGVAKGLERGVKALAAAAEAESSADAVMSDVVGGAGGGHMFGKLRTSKTPRGTGRGGRKRRKSVADVAASLLNYVRPKSFVGTPTAVQAPANTPKEVRFEDPKPSPRQRSASVPIADVGGGDKDGPDLSALGALAQVDVSKLVRGKHLAEAVKKLEAVSTPHLEAVMHKLRKDEAEAMGVTLDIPSPRHESGATLMGDGDNGKRASVSGAAGGAEQDGGVGSDTAVDGTAASAVAAVQVSAAEPAAATHETGSSHRRHSVSSTRSRHSTRLGTPSAADGTADTPTVSEAGGDPQPRRPIDLGARTAVAVATQAHAKRVRQSIDEQLRTVKKDRLAATQVVRATVVDDSRLTALSRPKSQGRPRSRSRSRDAGDDTDGPLGLRPSTRGSTRSRGDSRGASRGGSRGHDNGFARGDVTEGAVKASPAAPPSHLLPTGPITAAQAAIEQVLHFDSVHPAVAAFDSFRVDAEHAAVLAQDLATEADTGGAVLGTVPEQGVVEGGAPVALPTVGQSRRPVTDDGWASKSGCSVGAQARRAALKATESMRLRRAEADALAAAAETTAGAPTYAAPDAGQPLNAHKLQARPTLGASASTPLLPTRHALLQPGASGRLDWRGYTDAAPTSASGSPERRRVVQRLTQLGTSNLGGGPAAASAAAGVGGAAASGAAGPGAAGVASRAISPGFGVAAHLPRSSTTPGRHRQSLRRSVRVANPSPIRVGPATHEPRQRVAAVAASGAQARDSGAVRVVGTRPNKYKGSTLRPHPAALAPRPTVNLWTKFQSPPTASSVRGLLGATASGRGSCSLAARGSSTAPRGGGGTSTMGSHTSPFLTPPRHAHGRGHHDAPPRYVGDFGSQSLQSLPSRTSTLDGRVGGGGGGGARRGKRRPRSIVEDPHLVTGGAAPTKEVTRYMARHHHGRKGGGGGPAMWLGAPPPSQSAAGYPSRRPRDRTGSIGTAATGMSVASNNPYGSPGSLTGGAETMRDPLVVLDNGQHMSPHEMREYRRWLNMRQKEVKASIGASDTGLDAMPGQSRLLHAVYSGVDDREALHEYMAAKARAKDQYEERVAAQRRAEQQRAQQFMSGGDMYKLHTRGFRC